MTGYIDERLLQSSSLAIPDTDLKEAGKRNTHLKHSLDHEMRRERYFYRRCGDSDFEATKIDI
jgi:hypothetical protein